MPWIFLIEVQNTQELLEINNVRNYLINPHFIKAFPKRIDHILLHNKQHYFTLSLLKASLFFLVQDLPASPLRSPFDLFTSSMSFSSHVVKHLCGWWAPSLSCGVYSLLGLPWDQYILNLFSFRLGRSSVPCFPCSSVSERCSCVVIPWVFQYALSLSR